VSNIWTGPVERLWTPEFGGYDLTAVGLSGPKVKPRKGMDEVVNLRALGILPGIAGGAPRTGTHVASDVVTQTADGQDLNAIWEEFMELLNAVNAGRQAIIRFLTFPVGTPTELVAQPGDGVEFEEATEFGEPVGRRIQPTYFNMGYTFKWYDLAARYTWQYLADATAAMVNSVANAAVEAYWRKLMIEVLRTVYNATNLTATINSNAYNVFKFYNADGTVPPTYKNNTFLGTHTHFKTTGSAALEAQDLDTMVIDDFASHGYSIEEGYRLVTLVHTNVGNVIRNFRNAVSAVQAVGGNYGRFDFIPAQGQPGQIITQTQQIFGQSQVAPTLDGLTVIGTYGPLLIVQDDYAPTTHVASFATGGSESLNNPVGLREHANSNLRGMRLVKGRQADYPLIDSYWATGFGTGVRHRGGGIVLEITADATYDPPAVYA
jgi:hypothetical protein